MDTEQTTKWITCDNHKCLLRYAYDFQMGLNVRPAPRTRDVFHAGLRPFCPQCETANLAVPDSNPTGYHPRRYYEYGE